MKKGQPHGTLSANLGSVFSQPLLNSNGSTLWLEHAVEKASQGECYWLMWYDDQGSPPLPMSAVFWKDDLRQMISLLTDFVP